MTKKQMREKYTKMMELAQEDRDFYKNEVLEVVNSVCTEKEAEENSLRKLVDLAIQRTELLQREMLVRDWTLYQKAKREMSIVTEILCDLH